MTEFNIQNVLKDIPELLLATNDVEKSMEIGLEKVKEIASCEKAAIFYFSEGGAVLKSPVGFVFEGFNFDKISFSALSKKNFLKIEKAQNTIFLFPLCVRDALFGFLFLSSDLPLASPKIDAIKAVSAIISYSIKDAELSDVIKMQLNALQESVLSKAQDVEIIKEQNEKILEADSVKNEFLANISHELRTPLNAIIGFSEVLNSQIFGELNLKQKEYISEIYTSGVHLLGIINEILDISKLETNAMKLNYTDFMPELAIREVLGVMKPLTDKKKISVEFVPGFEGEIKLDYQKFQQIMYNLVGNAIKFTPEKGKIKISLEAKKDELRISVKDNGIGIAKENQEKIFEKFVQLENPYTKSGSSTGLGLTITKRFVEMMNGKIVLKSQNKKGSEFIVTFLLHG